MIAALEASARHHAARPAYAHKHGGSWRETNFQEYYAQVRRVARGLMSLGVGPTGNVAILSGNRPEWFLACLGTVAAGGVPTGIYVTSAPEQAEYIARHCQAAVVVVENQAHLATFLGFKHRLPGLRAIILLEGQVEGDGVVSWNELLARAGDVDEAELDARIAGLDPGGCASLIYTSGTTGPPKAVMVSHRNILFVARTVVQALGVSAGDRGLCYLPLSHVAEQSLSLFGPIVAGFATCFAESLEKVPENLREVRPSLFFGVPRVWEKMQAAISAGLAAASPWRRAAFSWARARGFRGASARLAGRTPSPGFFLARALALSKVRRRLGLDRARLCLVSAAPVTRDTLDFFLGLDIPLMEVYGMSECSGPATVSLPGACRPGRAGRALEGTEVHIAEDGEVLIRGPHVFLGYFRDEEATRATLDDEGFLHSGDIGELDEAGYLKITDRKKELLVTSGGKKTGPAVLESRLKQLPAVAQAVVVGDGRHYLAALFTLDPLQVAAVAATAGSPARDVHAAATCPVFRTHLEAALASANLQFARFETVKRFVVLPVEFTVGGGELTPTLKLKRRVIYEKYAAEIERLYS